VLWFNRKKKIVNATLTPVTAGFHVQAERILELNKRAMRGLKDLSVKVTIQSPSTIIPFEQVLIENLEEASKLRKIKKPGEILETGTWVGHSGITRSFNDIGAMRVEISSGFDKVFGQPTANLLFHLSDIERVLLTFIWNAKANTTILTKADWNVVYTKIVDYFEPKLKTIDIDSAKNKLKKLGLFF